MADVFISYKREDLAVAEALDRALSEAGYSSWWDTSLVAGEHFNEAIQRELATAQCVLVLWTKASHASQWVQAEAIDGFNRKILVAARLDDVELKYPFGIVQTADLRRFRAGSAHPGLADVIAGVAGKVGRPARSPPHPLSGGEGGVTPDAHSLNVRPDRFQLPKARLPHYAFAIVASVFVALLAWQPWRSSPLAGESRQASTPVRDGQVFRDCADCPEIVRIPGQSFAAGVYEVTFAEWDACVAAGGCNGYSPDDNGWGRGRRPVINVSWNDAQAYVQWLIQRTGQQYRLLTEAEWEYAARAGTTANFSWGDQGPVCDQGAPNGANFGYCIEPRTRPVGSFQPNAFRLYDVHGNVWEWVEDCYDSGCSDRVLRGGGWGNGPRELRLGERVRLGPTGRYVNGFRVARTA